MVGIRGWGEDSTWVWVSATTISEQFRPFLSFSVLSSGHKSHQTDRAEIGTVFPLANTLKIPFWLFAIFCYDFTCHLHQIALTHSCCIIGPPSRRIPRQNNQMGNTVFYTMPDLQDFAYCSVSRKLLVYVIAFKTNSPETIQLLSRIPPVLTPRLHIGILPLQNWPFHLHTTIWTFRPWWSTDLKSR